LFVALWPDNMVTTDHDWMVVEWPPKGKAGDHLI
jgi:hypothetical protein